MSEMDANNWTPDQAAQSGHPAPPESSPAPGAEQMGAPPAPTGAPPAPAQQPSPEHPRFNEVYRNWKETEREKAELEQRLAQYENLETQNWMPQGTPPPPPQQQPMPSPAQDDPEAWLKNTVAEALDEKLAPIQKGLAEQQQQQRLALAAAQFRTAHPEYNDTTDAARLLGTFRKYGGNVPLEDCYRFSFPERYAQGMQAPQGTPAPVADVRSSAPETPFGDTPEALMQKLAEPNLTNFQREKIGSQLRDLGAWGMGAAEKALGFD